MVALKKIYVEFVEGLKFYILLHYSDLPPLPDLLILKRNLRKSKERKQLDLLLRIINSTESKQVGSKLLRGDSLILRTGMLMSSNFHQANFFQDPQ